MCHRASASFLTSLGLPLHLDTPRLCLGDAARALGAPTQTGLPRTLDTISKGSERETR